MSPSADSSIERGWAAWARPAIARVGGAACLLRAAMLGLLIVASAGAAASTPKAADNADALTAYLRESRLDALLATHLESIFRSSEGTRRVAAARELAEVFARLLDDARDEASRAEFERRASTLVSSLPESESLDLRLTLSRSAYARAEDAAEKFRLRLASRADADTARRSFTTLEASLSDMATSAARRVALLEKEEENAVSGASDRQMLASALASARRVRSMSSFLAGWCAYYAAELDDADASGNRAAMASRARVHFGVVLNAKAGQPAELARVPEQLLSYEHVARAALGVALCESLRPDGLESASRWLALLEKSSAVPAPVRAALQGRRILVLARAGSWSDLLVFVRDTGPEGRPRPLSTADARLLAVLTLEALQAGEKDKNVQPLSQIAIESLAAEGRLAQVLDITSKYLERINEYGAGAFMPSYVRGLREYDRARTAHQAASPQTAEDQPATDAESLRAYRAAGQFLASALSASDAGQFPSALAGVALLRAMCEYYASANDESLGRAATLFIEAANRFDAAGSLEAAKARRLAIRALDQAVENKPAAPASLVQRRATLLDEFLQKHPAHPSAPFMLYRRATAGGRSTDAAVADLLSISDDSPLSIPARHQAARLLYESYLSARGAQRLAAAQTFLLVADPLVESLRRSLDGADRDAAERAALTARRVLDASLSQRRLEPSSARAALDLLNVLVARGLIDEDSVRGEILFRRVQFALVGPDWAEAELHIESLRSIDANLMTAALKVAYQRAADLWPTTFDDQRARAILARRIIELGERVMQALDPKQSPLSLPEIATLHHVVAQASLHPWRAEQDAASRDRAHTLYRALIEAHPRNATFLRASADLAQSVGDDAAALEAWRGLLSGLPVAGAEWFEAKCRVLELLLKLDPPRARDVFDQHRALYPGLGPPPYDERLRAVERALPAASQSRQGAQP